MAREKSNRNKAMFKLWKKNPSKWSFSKLGHEYNISKVMAHRIVHREQHKVNATVDKVNAQVYTVYKQSSSFQLNKLNIWLEAHETQ